MLPSLSRKLLRILPARTLNILLSPGGEDILLDYVNKILSSSTTHEESTFSFVTLIFVYLLLSILLRYVLEHAVATLLVIEGHKADGVALDHRDQKSSRRRPIFRYVSDAIRLIYRTQGVYCLARGLGAGFIYYLAHFVVRSVLSKTVFSHIVLRPVGYAVTSVLLCELHLKWTRTTISVRQQPPRPSDMQPVTGKKRRLALPAFLYGMFYALMYEMQGFMEGPDISTGQVDSDIGVRPSVDIFTVILMFTLRVFGLLPATIALTLTEASLLPQTVETVISSSTKERGATIGELLGGEGVSSTYAIFMGALRPCGRRQLLWLVELHLKNCLIRIVLEMVFLILLGVVLQ